MSKLNRIEIILNYILPRISIDDWMNDSKVIAELEKRAKQAEADFKVGELETAEKVFANFRCKESKCIK